MVNNLANFFKNKKVLITGHSGFKGSWLTQILLNWGAQITGVALKPTTTPNLFDLLGTKKKINNYFVDIRNLKKLKEIFLLEKPEIVFHLAAQPIVRLSYDDPLYTFDTNIMGTANVLQVIKEVKTVKSAVLITTDKVYENNNFGRPFKEIDKLGGYDPYSASKAAAEIVISSYIKSFFNPIDYNKKHTTLIASVRAGNIIGGGDWQKDRLIPDIIKSIFEKNEKIIIRNPDAVRPWQHVLEPLYGYMLVVRNLYEAKKEFSGAWNFGPSARNFLTVENLVKKILEISKKGSYRILRDNNKHEDQLLKLDSNKAKDLLGWQSVLSFDQALEFTFDWYKNFYQNKDVTIDFTNKQIESFFNKLN